MKTYVRAIEKNDSVLLKYRDEDGIGFEEVPFRNYFFISYDDYVQRKDLLETFSEYINSYSLNDIYEGYVTIYLNDNFKRASIAFALNGAGVETYESDIRADKRYLLDSSLKLNSEGLKWLMYDIETKDDGFFDFDGKGYSIAKEPILSVSFKDCTGKTLFLKNECLDNPIDGELDLLKKISSVFKQYDVVSAWNGKKFDDTYIQQRFELYNVKYDYFEFVNFMDYMEMVKKVLVGKPSYSLQAISEEILDSGKIDIGVKGKGAILRAWRDSFSGDTLLEDYNRLDVSLMFDIEQKLKIFDLFMRESEIAGCFIQETMNNSDINDYMCLRKFREAGIISPRKPYEEEKVKRREKRILGAEVFCLAPGVHEEVFSFDFKSFYPTTIAACNICVTTKINVEDWDKFQDYTKIPENYLMRAGVSEKAPEKRFRNDKVGIISSIARHLITERDKLKYSKYEFIKSNPDKYREMDLHERALKIVANSLYGALAFPSFRYYDFDVASAVTQFCREVILRCVRKAQDLGFIVIQGDTDSVMFKCGSSGLGHKDLEYEFYKMFDDIASELNMGASVFNLKNPKTGEFEDKKHFIVFEHEKTFIRMISLKKKNYADLMEVMDGDGNPTGVFKVGITGLECIKKDTNPVARELQRELIEGVLYDNLDMQKFLEKMRHIKWQLNSNTMPAENLVMVKSMSKHPDEYGKAMIDGKTGGIKKNKDGSIRYAAIPAHIKLAKRMIAEGAELFIGDNIEYVVKKQKPIEAISVSEYEAGHIYDIDYYAERIFTPVVKVLEVTHPDIVAEVRDLW